jgi:hypothetical protein
MGQDMPVWIDPLKRLRLLIEVAGRIAGLEIHTTFANIRYESDIARNRLQKRTGRESTRQSLMIPGRPDLLFAEWSIT